MDRRFSPHAGRVARWLAAAALTLLLLPALGQAAELRTSGGPGIGLRGRQQRARNDALLSA